MKVLVILVDFFLEQVNAALGALQALAGAHNPHIVPHRAAQFVPVVRQHHFFIRVGHPAVVPVRNRRNRRQFGFQDVLRRCPANHHAFQQRVAGQPVGAVQAGAGHFADGKQVFDIGLSV